MDKEFVEKMKDVLLKQKEELISRLASENEEFKSLIENMSPKDVADIASDDIDSKTLDTLGTNDIKRLRLIDSALSRVENGKYGQCMKCGKKITKERIEAIPYALMCIDCKSSDERRK